MALSIRLSRGGTKNRPFYRIVVADKRSPRDGKFIEKLGTYDPNLPHEHSGRVVLKDERIKYWLSEGAKPSDRVGKILGKAEIIPMPTYNERPQKSKPKAKAQERIREKAEKAEAIAAAAAEAKAEAAAETAAE